MKARGKREARRPWVTIITLFGALMGRNLFGYFGLSGLDIVGLWVPSATRLPLAFIMSRRWRFGPTFLCKVGLNSPTRARYYAFEKMLAATIPQYNQSRPVNL